MDIELPPNVIADVDQRTTALNHWLDGMIEAARDETPGSTPTEHTVAFCRAITRMTAKEGRIGLEAVQATLGIAIVRLAAVQDAAEGEL